MRNYRAAYVIYEYLEHHHSPHKYQPEFLFGATRCSAAVQDFDAATVIGFLNQYGLSDDFKLNLEVNHATLASHTMQHELEIAAAHGMLGSVDANRGDYQNGWDTDQFPIDLLELTEAMLVILESSGFQGGGINFDAKTRRNSTPRMSNNSRLQPAFLPATS